MSVTATVLFDQPQFEIASRIADTIANSTSTSIVTGFATPGGLDAIAAPIMANPGLLSTFVVGSATYGAFLALDELLVAGVLPGSLFVHLGYTSGRNRGGQFVRFHPMMHSKIYYMELTDGHAAAFIGSHNMTAFALMGQNAEASVLLEGPAAAPEFAQIRQHIAEVQSQSRPYSTTMKGAFIWWTKEFLKGLANEVGDDAPSGPASGGRSILIFATADRADRPVPGEYVYFEIPEGVEKIKDLDTEVHLFLFDKLPPNPHAALRQIDDAWAKYTCITPGADNKSGYVALEAQWHIEAMPTPRLKRDPSGIHRPTRSAGLQQVRAEVISPDVPAFEYLFEREQTGWIPEFDDTPAMGVAEPPAPWPGRLAWDEAMGPRGDGWQLVRNLVPRVGIAREKDQAVLEQLKPESGSFLLVSLRRRRI